MAEIETAEELVKDAWGFQHDERAYAWKDRALTALRAREAQVKDLRDALARLVATQSQWSFPELDDASAMLERTKS